MAGADHHRDPFLALLAIRRCGREGAYPPPLGEPQRGGDRRAIGVRIGCFTVGLVDAGKAQLVREPPLSQAACTQGAGLSEGIGCIVDIAKLGKPVRKSLEIRFAISLPTVLAKLPGEIGAELRTGRCIFADIAQGELLELRLVEGQWRSPAFAE